MCLYQSHDADIVFWNFDELDLCHLKRGILYHETPESWVPGFVQAHQKTRPYKGIVGKQSVNRTGRC